MKKACQEKYPIPIVRHHNPIERNRRQPSAIDNPASEIVFEASGGLHGSIGRKIGCTGK
jgi:hypothetical protein